MTIKIESLSSDDWQSLHMLCTSMYLEGYCYEFAIAVHRGTGWKLHGLMAGKLIRHAVVVDNYGKIHDPRGIVEAETVGEAFGLGKNCTIKPITESDLRKTRQINEGAVVTADQMARTLWPKYPWSRDGLRYRAEAFLKDLEKLCRKHKVWIRASHKGAPILIDHSYGDEGFRMCPTMTGPFMFDRTIK